MNIIFGNFTQWFKDKIPILNLRMRNLELCRVIHKVVIEQNINIYDSWRPHFCVEISAHFFFDFFYFVKQFQEMQVRFNMNNAIKEGDVPFFWRVGFKQRREF